MFKNVLVSVSDKSHLVDFLRPLVAQGTRVVSTGGTAQVLKKAGLKVVDVKEQTKFPEVFSGRVKTLHPSIFMPLLARSWKPEDQDILKQYNLEAFDLVICNLYPFEKHQSAKKDQELVEWIDIGGPSLLRAAAKNFFTITTICNPQDYKKFQKGSTLEQRKELASKVFKHVSDYDRLIAQSLHVDSSSSSLSKTPLQEIKKELHVDSNPSSLDDSSSSKTPLQNLPLDENFIKSLRYGENPHQKANWYQKKQKSGLHQAEILQGKELSFNNLLDLSSAVLALKEFEAEPSCVAVKHNNPCGVACANQGSSAVRLALEADPVSVFGGIVACNQSIDKQAAEHLTSLFLEAVIAIDFSKEALDILSRKKNLRVLKWPEMMSSPIDTQGFKDIFGGFLLQDSDQVFQTWNPDWKVIGKEPDEQIKKDLVFAWKVCSHLKSNAIAIVKNKQTLGLGMGQVNRVDAVVSATHRAKKFHQHKKDLVLASDAFFPFADSIDIAFEQGVCWIIQPGGSMKDEKVINRARQLGVNMILTGQRHFKH